MLFEALNDAADRGELLLLDGAVCHWHLCRRGARAGQLTIREIIVLPHCRRRGLATYMLARLAQTTGATHLLARCPADLEANAFYAARGFDFTGTQATKTGRAVNVWRSEVERWRPPSR